MDDGPLVAANPTIRSLLDLPAIFASDYWHPSASSGLYRPLVIATYALDHALWGLDPFGYHLVNVALHAAVSVLALALYRRVAGDAVSAAAAFLFAAHAVHSEAVANVVGRAELLCALFFLAALLLYAAARERVPGRRSGLFAASLIAYALALLSKENAATLLGVLVVWDLARRPGSGEGPLRALGAALREGLRGPYAGYALVTLFYVGVRAAALGGERLVPEVSEMDNPLVALAPPWRGLNALQVGFRGLGLLIFPLRLSYDYSADQIPLLGSWGEPGTWAVLALAAGSLAGLAWSWRASRPLFFALAFGAVTWSVSSNLLVTIGTIFGERLLYLPSVGFCLAAALAVGGLCGALPGSSRARRALFAGLFGAVVALNGARALLRNRDWESDSRVMLAALSASPRSAKVHLNAGLVYLYRMRRPADALRELETAIRIRPDAPGPHIHRGHALVALGRRQEAAAAFEAVLPFADEQPSLWNALGYVLVEAGIDPPRGVALLEKAVEREPENPHHLDSLGWAYYRTGRAREGAALIRRSLALDDSGESGAARRAHLGEVERALAEAPGAGGSGPTPPR